MLQLKPLPHKTIPIAFSLQVPGSKQSKWHVFPSNAIWWQFGELHQESSTARKHSGVIHSSSLSDANLGMVCSITWETKRGQIQILQITYCQTSSISSTKSQHLNVSYLILHFCPIQWSPLGVKSRMKIYLVGAAPTGDAPTTSEWSTSILSTKVHLILEVWQYVCHHTWHRIITNGLRSYRLQLRHCSVVKCFVIAIPCKLHE